MSADGSLRDRFQDPQGKRILVVGLARSGRAALDFFRRRGAVVTVSDSRPPWTFSQEIPELLAAKAGFEFGQHGLETFLRQDLIVVSPGVPWDIAPLIAAREKGIPVVAEVEAAGWFLNGGLIGVTGSNGKTTTTSLIGRMMDASGFPTIVGGNIGAPLIGSVADTTPETVVVAELSSFQLEGIEELHPRVAVVLNITANHLDRHPSFEAYLEAKARIFRNQKDIDFAVLNADDPGVVGLAERIPARKFFFSRTQDLPEGLLVSNGQVLYRVSHLERELFSVRDVKLRGDFNLENVLAASATACVLGADFGGLVQAVREFRGVEHRLEYVGDVLGVEFYNDSKATSVDATAKALTAFPRGVHLILGGKDKGAPYAPLIPLLKERVREVLVIGAAAERIARELAGTVKLVEAGDLGTAISLAFGSARPGDVILLSPACSSYDQFQDFEERGRVFKDLVEGLAVQAEAARTRGMRFQLVAPDDSVAIADDIAPVAAGRRPGPEPAEVSQPSLALAEDTPMPETPKLVDRDLVADDDRRAAPELVGTTSLAGPVTTGHTRGAGPAVNPVPSPPERIYVYELDAEEIPPLHVEAEAGVEEPVWAGEAAQDGTETALEGTDEPFIFEVRRPSVPAPSQEGSQIESATSPLPGRRGRKKRVKATAEGPERDDSNKDPGNLPGM